MKWTSLLFLPDTNLSLSDRVTPFLFLENDGQDYYLEIGGWGSGANSELNEATFQLSKRGCYFLAVLMKYSHSPSSSQVNHFCLWIEKSSLIQEKEFDCYFFSCRCFNKKWKHFSINSSRSKLLLLHHFFCCLSCHRPSCSSYLLLRLK